MERPKTTYNHLKKFNNHLQPPQTHLQPLANNLKPSKTRYTPNSWWRMARVSLSTSTWKWGGWGFEQKKIQKSVLCNLKRGCTKYLFLPWMKINHHRISIAVCHLVIKKEPPVQTARKLDFLVSWPIQAWGRNGCTRFEEIQVNISRLKTLLKSAFCILRMNTLRRV